MVFNIEYFNKIEVLTQLNNTIIKLGETYKIH